MEWNYRPVSLLEVAIPLLFLHPQGRQQQKRKACQERASFTASCYLSIVVVVVVCVCVFFLSFFRPEIRQDREARIALTASCFFFFFSCGCIYFYFGLFSSLFVCRFVSALPCLLNLVATGRDRTTRHEKREERKTSCQRRERERER